MDNERNENEVEHHRVRDTGRTVRGFLAGLLLAALVALGVDNRQDVRVGWIFGDGDAPLWLLLVIAAVAGAMIAALLRFRAHHRPH